MAVTTLEVQNNSMTWREKRMPRCLLIGFFHFTYNLQYLFANPLIIFTLYEHLKNTLSYSPA